MKVNDYKQMSVYIVKANGERVLCENILDGAETFWKSEGTALIAEFELKRRQSVSTWQTQISKAVYSRIVGINKSRRKVGLPEFTETTLAEAMPFTYTCNGNTITLVVFEKES